MRGLQTATALRMKLFCHCEQEDTDESFLLVFLLDIFFFRVYKLNSLPATSFSV